MPWIRTKPASTSSTEPTSTREGSRCSGSRRTLSLGYSQRRIQAGVVPGYNRLSVFKEIVSEGVSDDISRDGRLAASVGLIGEWCSRCMVKTGRALLDADIFEQSLYSSLIFYENDRRR